MLNSAPIIQLNNSLNNNASQVKRTKVIVSNKVTCQIGYHYI